MSYMLKKWVRNVQYICNKAIGHTVDVGKIFESPTLKVITPRQFLAVLNDYCQKNFMYKYDGKIDFAMHPEYFAWRKAGDCDDWSLFCLHICRLVRPYNLDSNIMMIYHNKEDGKQEGHAVCICLDIMAGEYYHIGNWGLFGPYKSHSECAASIFENWKRYVLLNYNFNVINEVSK